MLDSSPECAIFDLVNAVTNAPIRPVDTSAEPDREPDIRELFTEWRATAAHGITAPHDQVAAMFARAAGEQPTLADLRIHDTTVAAQTALDELAQARAGTAEQEA